MGQWGRFIVGMIALIGMTPASAQWFSFVYHPNGVVPDTVFVRIFCEDRVAYEADLWANNALVLKDDELYCPPGCKLSLAIGKDRYSPLSTKICPSTIVQPRYYKTPMQTNFEIKSNPSDKPPYACAKLNDDWFEFTPITKESDVSFFFLITPWGP